MVLADVRHISWHVDTTGFRRRTRLFGLGWTRHYPVYHLGSLDLNRMEGRHSVEPDADESTDDPRGQFQITALDPVGCPVARWPRLQRAEAAWIAGRTRATAATGSAADRYGWWLGFGSLRWSVTRR